MILFTIPVLYELLRLPFSAVLAFIFYTSFCWEATRCTRDVSSLTPGQYGSLGLDRKAFELNLD